MVGHLGVEAIASCPTGALGTRPGGEKAQIEGMLWILARRLNAQRAAASF